MTATHCRNPLLVVLILIISQGAFAWGDEGHRITARIAVDYLTKGVRSEVIRLLMTDIANNPDYYQNTCEDVLKLSAEKNVTARDELNFASNGLACIASWPDPPVKQQRLYTSNWHFVDVPVIAAKSTIPTLFEYDPARDCRTDPKRGDCAIQALERLGPVLADYKDPAATDGHQYGEELTSRAEALKFFVHIVGDIHQPLHCVTDKKDLAAVANPNDIGDMGGNNKPASWYGETETPYGFMNLHSIWDGGFIAVTMKNNNWSESQYAQQLTKSIPRDKAAFDAIRNGDLGSWARESYHLAVKNGYAKLPEYEGDCKMTYTNTKTNEVKTSNGCYRLGRDYYDANNPIVEQQLKSGGIRLAYLLNSILVVK